MVNLVKENYEEQGRLVVKLTKPQKKRLKMVCADLGVTMTDLLRSIVDKTLNAIEETGGYKF
jgi:antitoxin component of RelBE/YafQ-DinJ toxin-antitoxin module